VGRKRGAKPAALCSVAPSLPPAGANAQGSGKTWTNGYVTGCRLRSSSSGNAAKPSTSNYRRGEPHPRWGAGWRRTAADGGQPRASQRRAEPEVGGQAGNTPPLMTSTSRTPVRTRMPGGVAGERSLWSSLCRWHSPTVAVETHHPGSRSRPSGTSSACGMPGARNRIRRRQGPQGLAQPRSARDWGAPEAATTSCRNRTGSRRSSGG
jgi:hypothetical protein